MPFRGRYRDRYRVPPKEAMRTATGSRIDPDTDPDVDRNAGLVCSPANDYAERVSSCHSERSEESRA